MGTENQRVLKQKLSQAEAIVIGAGAGMSAAAGLLYSGERFEKNFKDFIAVSYTHLVNAFTMHLPGLPQHLSWLGLTLPKNFQTV